MQKERDFEIIINGHAAEPVTIHVNPSPKVILRSLKGRVHSLSERTSVAGIFIEDDVYLWDGEVCNVEEFLREWRGDDQHDPDRTFWMQIEDDGEIEISLNKVLRETAVFSALAKSSNVFFM